MYVLGTFDGCCQLAHCLYTTHYNVRIIGGLRFHLFRLDDPVEIAALHYAKSSLGV